jgi:hypothetical protein
VYIYVMFLYCKVKTLKHNNTKVFRVDRYKGSKHKTESYIRTRDGRRG